VTGDRGSQAPFQAHVELLQSFLAHREKVVERVQDLLNAQRKPASYLQDRLILSRYIGDCFFTLTAVTDEQARLKGQLQKAHWASGFKPRHVPELHNDLIDPAELMVRGFYLWQQTRWPGRNGRVRYAHTLYNLYLIRSLALLSMRLWDDGPERAGDRLVQVQALLDELWGSAPADQPELVRDARWLPPLAQSPTTDELAAYLDVAERIAEMPMQAQRLEIQKAHVLMIGGHLRSQTRHYCMRDGLSLDEDSVVRRTRTSNALDFALLIQSLVALLEAYENARDGGDAKQRLDLAHAICQGISPDPELFLNRVDLLGAYSMIQHLFVGASRDGRVAYTPMGRRHVQLLRQYEAKINQLAKTLHDDCPHFRPVEGAYSPYGAIYGTPTNLIEDMALKTLQSDAVTRFGLEDVFTDGNAESGKLAWVNGWRQLPHVDREVQKLYEYPQQFADDIYARIEQELGRHVCASETNDVPETGRLHILPEDKSEAAPMAAPIPELPVRYIVSSDPRIVAAQRAESYDQTLLLHHRQEGHFALSYETPGGWVAIKKDFLTEVLGAGRDANVIGLPPDAAEVLRLMCPDLVVPELDR